MAKRKESQSSQGNDINPKPEIVISVKPENIHDQEKKADQLNANITKDERKLLDEKDSREVDNDSITKLAKTAGSKTNKNIKRKSN
ncbi:MAG: hypothetical protein ACSLE0_05225 [Chitinophagaceae bacterium]